MRILISLLPWATALSGAALIGRAFALWPARADTLAARRRLGAAIFLLLCVTPLAQAQTADLQTATQAGDAVIMYVCGVLVAIGIVTAGVAMMMGRQSIAKWALAGALISGLAFPIVKTLWSNVGLTAPDVSTFTQ